MFDFEKLEIYQQLRELNIMIYTKIVQDVQIDPFFREEFKKASLDILFNLAEGTGRVRRGDKKEFYVRSRSALFECTTLVQVLRDLDQIDEDTYQELYDQLEQGSKMLLGLIRSMSQDD